MRSSEAGRCPLHPDIQLSLQKANGEWFNILPACPLCAVAFDGHDRHPNSSTATMTSKEHSKKSRRSKKEKEKGGKNPEDKCKDDDEEDFGRSLLEEMDREEAAQITKQKKKSLSRKPSSRRDKNKSTKPIPEMDEQGGHESMQTWTPPIHNQIYQVLLEKDALEQQHPQKEGGRVKDKRNHCKTMDLSHHTQSTMAITIDDEVSLTLAGMKELPDIEDDIAEEKQKQITYQTTTTQDPQLRRGVGSQGREASTARNDIQRSKVLRALKHSLEMDYNHGDAVTVTSDDAAVVPGEGISKENTVMGHQREDQTHDHQTQPPTLDDDKREPQGGRKGRVVIGNRSRAPSRSGTNTQALARSDANKTASADDKEAARVSASDAIMAKALTKWEAKWENADSMEVGLEVTGGTGRDADVASRDVVISEGAEASSLDIQAHNAGSGEYSHIDKSITTRKSSSTTTTAAATSMIEPENKMRIGETVLQLDIFAPPGKLGVTVNTPPHPGGLVYVSSVREHSILLGKLRVGDKIVAVDDEDVREMLATHVCRLLVCNGSNGRRKITVLRKVVEIDYVPVGIIEPFKTTTSLTTPKSAGRASDENSAEGDISSQLPEPDAANSEEHILHQTQAQTQASKMGGRLRRQAMDLSACRALEISHLNIKCSVNVDIKIVVPDAQNDETTASSKAATKYTGGESDGHYAKEETLLSDVENPPRPDPDDALLEEQRIHQAQAQTRAPRQKGVEKRHSMDLTVRRALARSHRTRKCSAAADDDDAVIIASDAENDETFAKEKNIDLNYGSSARTDTNKSGEPSSHPPTGEEYSDSDADTSKSEAASIDIYFEDDAFAHEEMLSVFEQFHEMYPPTRRARRDQMGLVANSAPNLVDDDRSPAKVQTRCVSLLVENAHEVLEPCDEFDTTPPDFGVLLPRTHSEGWEDSVTIHGLTQQQQANITHHQSLGTIDAGSRLSSRKGCIATEVKWDKRGYCKYHPTIQLRKKKVMWGWKVVQNVCPDCRAKDIESFLKRNSLSPARQRQPRETKKVLNMPLTFSDSGSVIYTGEVDMSNIPSGRGSIYDPTTGFVAKGDWINGKMNGAVDC